MGAGDLDGVLLDFSFESDRFLRFSVGSLRLFNAELVDGLLN